MDEVTFSGPEELIAAFGIPGEDLYCRITPLGDRKVGFSVQTHYPPDMRFVPPKNRRGENDVVALIHVVYVHPSETSSAYDANRVPIIIRIGTHSRYRESHFDYDFADERCPTRESMEGSKKTPWPISLEFHDEFFYDHSQRQLKDKGNRPISGLDILEKVFKQHCDTIGVVRGVGLRTRLRTQKWLVAFLGLTVDFLIRVQKTVFGRELDEGVSFSQSLTGYRRQDFKKLNTESLDILGYKASKAVIIIFCFLTVVGYAIKYRTGVPLPYLKAIFSNNFLTLTHSVLLVWLLDLVLPNCLYYLINVFIGVRSMVIFGRKKK